jgi:glycosyltransferase involved in cell wall biosynthesis
MSIFKVPVWVQKHLYAGKKMEDLAQSDIAALKERLSRFKSDQPVVSVMIPAWNEQDNIFRTLSSLADSTTKYPTEIVVINNNSTDRTQELLDILGVLSYMQREQGTAFAREMGLEKAKGKYHLCADSDTYYPPDWIDLMVEPMKQPAIVGVYGRYSFLPPENASRFPFWVYEKITGILVRLRKKNREYLNTLGFNMGFVTEVGRQNGGFKVTQVRKFDNAIGSEYFVYEAEDGRMAVNLKKTGKLKMVTKPAARVYTSSRRLMYEGGIWNSFMSRFKDHSKKLGEYVKTPE